MKNLTLLLSVIMALSIVAGCKTKPNGGTNNNGHADTTAVVNEGNDDRFTETEEKIMWVAPYTQTCQGEAEMECMLVSFNKDKPAQGEWELFYDGIKGFNYEKGNLYQLRVKVGMLKAKFIMADASDREYILLEVLRKDGA